MKTQIIGLRAAAVACAVALYGCDGGTTLNGPEVVTPDNTVGETTPGDVPAILAADSADDLIRESLLGFYTSPSGRGAGVGGTGGVQIEAIAAPVSADLSDSASTESGSGQSRFSNTNVQEQGVDESDRVKIDGDVLFALERPDVNYYGYGGPFPVDVAIDVIDVLPGAIPYQPQIDTLSAYRLDGDNSSVVSRLSLDALSGRSTTGMYLHKNGSNTDLVLLSGQSFSPWDSWGTSLAWSGLETRISWVDASDAGNMSVTRSMDIQGHLISSRRVDNRLILVTRFHPQIPGILPYVSSQADIETNRNIIANADVSDFMPTLSITEDGNTVERPIINDNLCYSTKATDDQGSNTSDTSLYYPSPSIVSIINIDLNNLNSNISNACFIGDSETLYVSQQAVYLATTQYEYASISTDSQGWPVDEEIDVAITRPLVYVQPDITTEIHKFSFNGAGAPVFKGSGSVKGHLGWNPDRKPFRMSEKDGNLRVVTFDESRDVSPVTLSILRESGGKLATLSTLPNNARPAPIGKPGESLYASRFIGDRAYLVTFRVTDPLYVLDVSNPNDPSIAGELEIPGYSDYLHPVNDSLLIGLGKDAIAASNIGWGDGRGAWYQGVKLALYDVADPANPFVADERIIGKRGSESPALSQHHSFAYLQGNGARNARFAFPAAVHNEPTTGQPQAWSEWTSNNLLTMEVDENSNKFVDVPGWKFESRDSGFQYSPVGLENDRAIIGTDGGLYMIHNGTLHYGQWGNSEPTASVSD